MDAFSERLRQLRLDAGLSQEAFGRLGGVQKQTQIKYEKGERSPDAQYLTGLHSAGVDVGYLLTGERSQPGGQASQSPKRGALVQTDSDVGVAPAYIEERERNVYMLPAQPSGLTEKEVCSLIIDILHAKRRTLPSTTVWAIVDSIMALQRGGISVDKSTIDTQLQLVK